MYHTGVRYWGRPYTDEMKTLQPGTDVRVLRNNRIRHAIVLTVTDQNTITARIGRTSVSAARQPSTTTRGTLFEVPAP